MNEIGDFFIKFNTEGLLELKDGLRDLSTKLDSINESFTKSTTKGNDFFSGFGGWLTKISALTAGIFSLGKVIKDTFNIGDKIINLNLLADAAGATAEEVEALSIATQPFGGSVQSAANFYRTMSNLQTEWGRGQYGESMREELSRAGFFVSPNATREQYISALSSALTAYTNAGKFGDREKLAKAFGLDDSMMLFLSGGQDNVNKKLEYGRQHSVLSGRDNLQVAQELRKASNELKEAWNRFLLEMMPVLRDVLIQLKPIAEALAPIAKWAIKQMGGLLDTAEQVKKLITGESSLDEVSQHLLEQDSVFGDAARAGQKAGNWLSKKWEEQDAKKALARINSGTASMQDIGRVQNYLTEQGLFDDKAKQALNMATKQILATNNTLNTARTTTTNNAANVDIHTINITGMGETAGIRTKDAVQKQLNTLTFQPATVAMGVK
jgi:hypothetical protein